jgi:protein TilB
MGRITEELLRKRSEHNDGVLPDLEEISLHQQELEKIENLESCCRHIKILYLQNNIIPKLEGLTKLKELEYLNIALNNIPRIEGLEGCESLNKLDMTVNFVDVEDLESSVNNLRANTMLEDLYMMGNACMEWDGAKEFIIGSLWQIKQLDGNLISKTERIQARQKVPQLLEELRAISEANLKHKEADRLAGKKPSEGAYTIESRNEMYKELEEQKMEKERNEKKRMGLEEKPPRELPGVYNMRGDIRQCNEGKYDFYFEEDEGKWIALELAVPRHLHTDQIECDVNPYYVRCVIKEKVTQLKIGEEVSVSKSTVQRSKTTGRLRIHMPLANPREVPWRKKKEEEEELQPLQPEEERPAERERLAKAVSLRVAGKGEDIGLREAKVQPRAAPAPQDDEDFEDDPDVPPLEYVPR